MTLKNFFNCVVNRVRVLTITTALIVHTQKLCWLGLCPDEKPAETTVGSVIFAIALGLLLAEYDLVPDKINCPSTTTYCVVMVSPLLLFLLLLLVLVVVVVIGILNDLT